MTRTKVCRHLGRPQPHRLGRPLALQGFWFWTFQKPSRPQADHWWLHTGRRPSQTDDWSLITPHRPQAVTNWWLIT